MTTSNQPSSAGAGPVQALTRSPALWGALACGGFYALIHGGVFDHEYIQRYLDVRRIFASHPVEYIMTAMFVIGMAALAIKVVDVAVQYQGLGKPLLGPIPRGGQPTSDSQPLEAQLERLPRRQQSGYRVRRLQHGLEHVGRSRSAETLDEHLKYLADLDADRAHNSYGLVRMFIWAIPILGFLGTVVGIAQAMGNLAPQALEDSLPQVMTALTVAFDTTQLALGLCIVLFFAQFLTHRQENRLLAQVDERVEAELVGRFEQLPQGPDGQLVAVRRMMETVVESTEQLVERQAGLWRTSMDAAQERWATMANTAGAELRSALAGALAESLKLHAQEVVIASRLANEENRRNWQNVHQSLVESTETVANLQKAVIQKAEVLGRAVQGTDQVAKLQETLNQNLRTLAGAKNFEQTVMSLAAVIHLLNARLGELPADSPQVELELDDANRKSQAA